MRALNLPTRLVLALATLAALVCASCASSAVGASEEPVHPDQLALEAGVLLTSPPYRTVHVQWKERVAQPYVYFEHRGERASFGATMRSLLEFSVREHVSSVGSPFALYYPDGSARACLPVAERPNSAGLSFEVLPKAMVAYAVVAGAYPDAVRALPGLRAKMQTNGWEDRGPVRAIYLVNPAQAKNYAELATELQIPWAVTP